MTAVSLTCFVCQKQYYSPLNFYNLRKKRNSNAHDFCSHNCHNQSRKIESSVTCDECGISFAKRPSQITKTKHNFCTKSCSAIYRNKHKVTGTRRSKLEVFIERQILQHFPHIKCNFNDHIGIGSELDIYFPILKLAIQINGVTHYQPIYGQNKLDKIKLGDENKRLICKNNDIKLFEIDVSKDISFESTKDKRWIEIQSIINDWLQIKDSNF